jgi:hypothetical protein
MSAENQILLNEFIPSRSNVFEKDGLETTITEKAQRLENAFNVDLNFEREKKAIATGIAIGIPTILALANPATVHAKGHVNDILATNADDTAGWVGLGLGVAEELVEGTNIKKAPRFALKAAAGWVLGKSLNNLGYLGDYLNKPELLTQFPNRDYLAQIILGTYTMAKTTSLSEFKEGLANTFTFVTNLIENGKGKLASNREKQSSDWEERQAWKLYRSPNIREQAEGERRLIDLQVDLKK